MRPSLPCLALSLLASTAMFVSSSSATADAGSDAPRPYRFPDIHGETVVFAYAGDIWSVPTEGGTARRLTTQPGLETFPRISRDGRWLAYTAEVSGTRQVWVMPLSGGEGRQLTFYGDVGRMAPRGGFDYWIQDWTADGRILVRANRTPWGQRMGRYYFVDPDGGLETPLPLMEGGSASISADGRLLAYTPVDREFRTWKRTRGGRAQDVWLYDLEKLESRRVTDHRATDNFPMWWGEEVYFTSDRDDALEIWAWSEAAPEPRRVAGVEGWDVLWPQAGPDAIVFVAGGRLWRLDPSEATVRPIPVSIEAELPERLPRFRDVASFIQAGAPSPSGARAIFESRGELFSVPKEHGPTRNLTGTPGTRERAPAWSPDGRWLAFFSDRTGEAELWLRDLSGREEDRSLTPGNEVWADGPVWSPDSGRIAFWDRARRLRVVEVSSGEIRDVDRGLQGDLTQYAWSPDSRWLVYQATSDSGLPGIAVWSVADDSVHRLGDGLTFDRAPVISSDGRHVIFLSERDLSPTFSTFEAAGDMVYTDATRIFAASLDAGATPLFPLRSDEESIAEEPDADAKGGDDAEAPETRTPEPAGFRDRTVALPGLRAGTYANLVATPGGVLYLRADAGGPPTTLAHYSFEGREEKVVRSGVVAFQLAAGGERVLWQGLDGSFGFAAATGNGEESSLDLSRMRLKLDPGAEWAQIFDEAWRITRDWFYDPEMHGYDWNEIGERYRAMVPHLGHRTELDFVLGEMISELEAGHTYVQAGDDPQVARVPGGKLGAELEVSSGHVRIARLFRGEAWDDDWRSPLSGPGIDVDEGDLILAIDGVDLTPDDNPYRLLEGKADMQVTLTVADADGEREREVVVHTVADEGNLRYLAWVRERMDLVHRLSDGRIGYIHLPNTALEGNRMLHKLFYGQVRKEALIVDDRYNGGGFIPHDAMTVLERFTRTSWARRDIESFHTPAFAHDGPKAMLINAHSSSGGDALPYYFRQRELGTLIGTRTWGGLIGISGAPALSDGGTILPPTFRVYDREGEWIVENEGVEPDIEVFDLPESRIRGGDPSIEKAVEVLMRKIEAWEGWHPPAPPEPPDLSGPAD